MWMYLIAFMLCSADVEEKPDREIDMEATCAIQACVLPNLPFGVGLPLVRWNMKQRAPHIIPQELQGGQILTFHEFRYLGVQTAYFWAQSNIKDRFGAIVAQYMVSRDADYPETVNMYFHLRDMILNTENYGVVRSEYSFKHPFEGTSEDEAKDGYFKGDEREALEKDHDGVISDYRFGKVFTEFRHTSDPNVRAFLIVANQEIEHENQLLISFIVADERIVKIGK